jgi:hypothetical protein
MNLQKIDFSYKTSAARASRDFLGKNRDFFDKNRYKKNLAIFWVKIAL